MTTDTNLIIVGAGLSGLLTAWRCLDLNPALTVTIIDGSDKVAGDHTWSFNLTDIDENLREWIRPFIAYEWPRYDVKFPNYRRRLDIPYCSGSSNSLRSCVEPFIKQGRLITRLGVKAQTLTQTSVTLANCEVINAGCVFDARGFEANDSVILGYQKFVGRTIRTKDPHGLVYPIIMDATVEQLGGYRFVYCLPFSDHDILVEDTYYTDGPELDEREVLSRIKDYVHAQGWEVDHILRDEKGVLPITLAALSPTSNKLNWDQEVPRIGLRAGFYNAVTGYSFPYAVQTANAIAEAIRSASALSPYTQFEFGAKDALELLSGAKQTLWQEEKFLRYLNRMLFRAADPEKRYKVLQRFYGLQEGLIERFYAGTLTRKDKIRILSGKPPVPIMKAAYNLSERAFIKRERAKKD